MRRILILATVLSMFVPLIGCAGGDGVAITARQRAERHRRIQEENWKQMQDDWDLLWLNDRPSRLTRATLE